MGEEQTNEKRGMIPAIADALLAPLGQMTANFAMLESQVSFSIGFLIGGEQRLGNIVTADLSFMQLVNIFHALVLYRSEEEPEVARTVGDLRKRLIKAAEQRNTLTHSLWGAGPEQGVSTRLKQTTGSKGGWKLSAETVSPDDISGVAEDFAVLTSDIVDLIFLRGVRKQTEGPERTLVD